MELLPGLSHNPGQGGWNALSPYKASRIVSLVVEEGLPRVVVAERLGVCVKTVRRYLNFAGVPKLPTGPRPKPDSTTPPRTLPRHLQGSTWTGTLLVRTTNSTSSTAPKGVRLTF